MAAFVSVQEVAGEAARRQTAVDLEGHREHAVARQVRLRPASVRPLLIRQVAAEIVQENLQPLLLGRLGVVVGRPILLVRWSVRRRHLLRYRQGARLGYGTVAVPLPLDRELDRVQVLALTAASLEIRAGAGRSGRVDGVAAFASLARHRPCAVLLLDPRQSRDRHSPLLAFVRHGHPSRVVY